MTECSEADCSANVFVIASVMRFYNPDVRTAGEPRLAACLEKPETPPRPNQQGKVSYTTLPLLHSSSYSKHTRLRKLLARREWHQLDDMVNANIWDSSVDHRSHNNESASCQSALGKLRNLTTISHIHSFFGFIVLMLRDTSTWAGSLPEHSVIFVASREKTQAQVSSCAHFSYSHLHSTNAERSLGAERVGTRGKQRADSERETGREQILLANAIPFSPAGLIV